MKCPCCGGRLAQHKNPSVVLALLPMGKVQRRIVDKLARQFGAYVRRDELLDAAYFDDPNGGPDDSMMRVHIHRLAAKMAKTPLTIKSRMGLGGWRMAWREGVSP